ncbi:MAG: hypothetical protein KGJ51_08755 [Acidobacteriota bacterium]|nr:hypothetical protein [Acidobacteriota bacterium]
MKRPVTISLLLPLVGLLACGPDTTSIAEAAQSGTFAVTQRSLNVGTANYQFTRTRDGYNSSSLVKVSMKGLDYALSKTEQLTSAEQLQHVQISATVNSQAVTVTAAPDSAQMLLNMSADGKSTTARLTSHAATVFLPDVDPGALQTLLTLAAAHNNRDVWAIIPKGEGAVLPVQLATYPDEQGTLNGKSIPVHHLVSTIGHDMTDLFVGPQNQLLQAELRTEGLALIHQGFLLTPPAKPLAPPSMPSGPPNGQQGQAGQQGVPNGAAGQQNPQQQYPPQQYPAQGQQQQYPQQYQQNQYPQQQYPQQQYPQNQYPQQQ